MVYYKECFFSYRLTRSSDAQDSLVIAANNDFAGKDDVDHEILRAFSEEYLSRLQTSYRSTLKYHLRSLISQPLKQRVVPSHLSYDGGLGGFIEEQAIDGVHDLAIALALCETQGIQVRSAAANLHPHPRRTPHPQTSASSSPYISPNSLLFCWLWVVPRVRGRVRAFWLALQFSGAQGNSWAKALRNKASSHTQAAAQKDSSGNREVGDSRGGRCSRRCTPDGDGRQERGSRRGPA